MKKLISILLCLLLTVLVFAGCSKENGDTDDTSKANSTSASAESADTVTAEMPTVLSTAEYTLYQNVFFNNLMEDYDGKETTKEGTFTTLYDAYNGVERYYVWGYNDQTKCCDWQWELKPDGITDLPSNGSLVTVKGVYEMNGEALDNLWISDPEITVKTYFEPREVDVDMMSMGDTLERVQVANIIAKQEQFEGKTFTAYGRVKDSGNIEDPYYDGSWSIGISGEFELPAFGTIIELSGVIKNGALADCRISPNTQY